MLTLATMLTDLGRATGTLRRSGTTTAAGSATTAVDSGLISPAPTNNMLKDFWLLGTSGTYGTLALRRFLDSHTGSSGTMTWLDALAGNFGSGVTYQLYTIDPQYLADALNDARLLCSKYVFRQFTDFLVANSPVVNGCFTWWDATNAVPMGWVKSNSALTSVSNSGPNNNYVAKLTSSDATARWLETQPTFYADSLALAGKTIKLYCDMQSDTASHARVGVLLNSTKTYMDKYYNYNGTTTTSGYAPADALWYRAQNESVAVLSTINAVQFLMEIAHATAVTRFSKFYITGGPRMTTYPVVGDWLGEPTDIYVQTSPDLTRRGFQSSSWIRVKANYEEIETSQNFASSATNRVGRLVLKGGGYPDGYLMKWVGKAYLSSVSLLTDSMEVDHDTKWYLYECAKYVLFNRLAEEHRHDDKLRDDYKKSASEAWQMKTNMEDKQEHASAGKPDRAYPMRFF